MTYTVVIHPEAELDFQEHFDRIVEASYDGALRWESEFEAMTNRLAQNPYQYGYAREEAWLQRGLRAALFKTKHGNTYHAVYVVADQQVTILRVRGHGQSDLSRADIPSAEQ